MGTCNQDGTPILINTDDNNPDYELTAAGDGVTFDIFADGRPVKLAWTNPASNVGFLALDRNGNGAIDSGAELFGNYTPKRDGTLAANGFEALLDLDGGPQVSNGRIDRRDAAYSQLKLWFDRDHSGTSSPDELVSLQDAGVATIFTTYRVSRRVDRYGNKYLFAGVAFMNTSGRIEPRRVFDVVFKRVPLS